MTCRTINPDQEKSMSDSLKQEIKTEQERWANEKTNLHTSLSQLLKNCDVTWHDNGCTISTDEDDLSAIQNACQVLGLEAQPLRTDLKHRVTKDGVEHVDNHLDHEPSKGKHNFKVRK
ncbi:MAG TPA: hypothetical protein VM577_08135 [Anaerovoracaceae bacterium]|nr:hypothetical protein [Anaerovoracaceae bacterium]